MLNFGENDVWCICLEGNNKRYQSSLDEFKKVGLIEKVKYHRPIKDPRGGRIGCWLSHLYCMKESLKRNQKYVIIFEDDVTFIKDWKNSIDKIEAFLKYEPNWDIFRLGSLITSLEKPSKTSSKIWKSRNLSMHGWIINMDFMTKLLKNLENFDILSSHLHIDDYIHNLKNINDYVLIYPICNQKNDMSSDINWFSYNILQNIIQNKNYYEFFQELSNTFAWHLRFLPSRLQEYINFLPLSINIGIFLNYLLKP